MKKLLPLIYLIVFHFFFHTTAFAEIINGPAEVKDAPNGTAIVKLNDGVEVKCSNCLEPEAKWNSISITIKYKGNDCSSNTANGEILYDEKNNIIGKVLDAAALYKIHNKRFYEGYCISNINAYIKSEKIRDDSIIQISPAFYDALVNGKEKEIEEFLLNKKNVNAVYFNSMRLENETPLMLASRYGFENIVKLLIAKGANINTKTKHYGWTALFHAINSNNENQEGIVRILLAHGADINEKDREGDSAMLHSAGKKKFTSLLLANGADINAQNGKGDTLLIIAARAQAAYFSNEKKAFEFAKFLIEQGADIEHRNKKGDTALIAAYGFDEMRDLLISKGADINAQNLGGQTALMLAARGNYNSFTILLLKGADINKKDIFGRTALWYARNCHNITCRNIERILREHGAFIESEEPYEQKFNCDRLMPDVTYAFTQGDTKKELLLLSSEPVIYSLEGYLKEGDYCRPVLFEQASWGKELKNNVGFRKSKTSEFPDIVLKPRDWHKLKINTVYIWNGRRYELEGLRESIELNKKALDSFSKGDIQGAITIWEDAYKLALWPYNSVTVNAEVVNNLGFAYHKLAQQMKSEDYYKKAEQFYNEAQVVDRERWEAYLNLGDLYAETGAYRDAILNYDQLLYLNPDYKYADLIRSKIKTLEEKAKKGMLLATMEKVVIGKDMPLYTFKLFGDSKRRSIERIAVYRADSKKELQTIEFSELDIAEDPTIIEFEDINFDGYRDIKIRLYAGATGNEGYSYYLFYPKTKGFTFNKDFTDLERPKLFPDKKQFVTFGHSGNAGANFYEATYEVRNGKPVLIRYIRQEYLTDKGYFLRIEKELIDGEMKVVKEIKDPQD